MCQFWPRPTKQSRTGGLPNGLDHPHQKIQSASKVRIGAEAHRRRLAQVEYIPVAIERVSIGLDPRRPPEAYTVSIKSMMQLADYLNPKMSALALPDDLNPLNPPGASPCA